MRGVNDDDDEKDILVQKKEAAVVVVGRRRVRPVATAHSLMHTTASHWTMMFGRGL